MKKLKYFNRAEKKIHGRHAGGCTEFNWLNNENKTCKPLYGELKHCIMLDGIECENYTGKEVRTDEI